MARLSLVGNGNQLLDRIPGLREHVESKVKVLGYLMCPRADFLGDMNVAQLIRRHYLNA